jgi:hypothetical protein
MDQEIGVETEDEEALALYKTMVRRMSCIQVEGMRCGLK